MPDAAPITTAMQRRAIDDQTDVLLPVANVSDEYSVFCWHRAALPEHHLIAVAGQEVATGFIASQMVQFYSQHMAVIEDHQTPAVARLHSAGAINPRNVTHPVNELLFIHLFNHSASQAIQPGHRGGQCFG